MELKRKLYVFSFTLLGLLIGLLLKNLVEIIYLKLLLNDFVTYSFGLTWDELLQYYFIFSLIVTLVTLYDSTKIISLLI